MPLRIATVAAAAAFAATAAAQGYPAKPVRLVVPFPPGGTVDVSARAIAPALTEALGQNVIVDNRGGAQGMVGSALVAKSPPDGYTLLMGISTLATIPSVFKVVRYDALKDLAPISQAVTVPNVLVVHP